MIRKMQNLFVLKRLLAGSICCAALLALRSSAADPAVFSDGFEAPTLDGFWTTRLSLASITLSSAQVHSGTQAAQFSASGYGQKDSALEHRFASPQYGKISVWVYDQKNYIYFSTMVHNTALGQGAGIGVQDWDYSAYYSVAGKTSFPRSVGWHLFSMEFTASAFVASIDGQVVYSGPGGVPYDKIVLQMTGPGSGGVVYDDFAYTAAPDPAGLLITGLDASGQLSWTNGPALTNGLFTIEWASAPGTNWQSSWTPLAAFAAPATANAAQVPMLYRLKCVTNLFLPCPNGGRLTFAVSNAVGGLSTEQITCLSRVKPSAAGGKEYVLLENVASGHMGLQLLRSTDSAVYRLDANTLEESLEFRIAPPGSTWTNYNYEGQWNLKVTVEAIESVTVLAGTFANCYKFRKQALNYPGPELPEWYEWVKPGLGLVKWIDHWVPASESPPVVHQLQSLSQATP
jgi:hypothetical protein